MTTELEDPVEELTREVELAQRLVERLGEIGQGLRTGTNAAPGEISEGIRLLGQYRNLHAGRFADHLLPEARPVAMPSCFEHLDAVVRGVAASGARIVCANAAVEEFAQGLPGAGDRLAAALDELTEKEYDDLRHEMDYPLSCLLTTLPGEAAARVRDGFAPTSTELADLESHIDRYLSRPAGSGGFQLAIRCSYPGCSATGSAVAYPGVGGYLGARAPQGWSARPGTPHPGPGHTVSVGIEFRCPSHAVRPPAGPASTLGATPDRPAGSEPRTAPCCQPVSDAPA